MAQYVKKKIICLVNGAEGSPCYPWKFVELTENCVCLVDTAIQVLICRKLKDTEEEDDVRLCHELCLTAAVDVTLKTHSHISHFSTQYIFLDWSKYSYGQKITYSKCGHECQGDLLLPAHIFNNPSLRVL